eukprot:4102400-Pyramimonas_sp.AAC.1
MPSGIGPDRDYSPLPSPTPGPPNPRVGNLGDSASLASRRPNLPSKLSGQLVGRPVDHRHRKKYKATTPSRIWHAGPHTAQ